MLTAGTWTAASPVLKAVQKFAKILDWTGEVVGVVFKGLGKLGGLIFKGKGALSKLLEKAGAAAAKVLEPLEKLATRFLNFADEMLGKVFGKAAKEADTIWIATDEDREGEAIGWHLCEVLKIDPTSTKRIVFHEITPFKSERP